MEVYIDGCHADVDSVEIVFKGEDGVGDLSYIFSKDTRGILLYEEGKLIFDKWDDHGDLIDEIVKLMD